MVEAALSGEERTLVAQVSPEKLMESTSAIARWVRLSGTPEEAAAFDWIQARLEEYGLQTARYSFPSLVSWPESASLEVTGADGRVHAIPCATHGFAASTPDEGFEAELVYAGKGSEAEIRQSGAAGKIALIDGIIAQNHNLVAERAGVAASVWIAGGRLHERILSPVWGTPTPETASLLPKTPSVSVLGSEGVRLKEILASGPARARLRTRVFRGWKEIPVLTGDLRPAADGPESDTFVMLSGHVDSWYYGAMDNGSANAAQLEVARLLAERRGELRRGLRVAFWSGHSHGRYSGSAWYADNCWQELHDSCVAHVNVDSLGARGATVLSEGNSMEEVRSFASEVIELIAGQRLEKRRYGRSGDQSFWGHGFPAMLMSLSEQPPEGADPALLALHHQIGGGQSAGGGLGWWWHTPDDTLDKIDPDFLKRDAQIYALIVYRLCARPVLPFDYRASVAEMKEDLAAIATRAGDALDLSPAGRQLEALGAAVEKLYSYMAWSATGEEAVVANRCLMKLGRALIPVNYSRTGPFDQDLAVPTKPFPGLQAAVDLPSLPVGSDEYHFLRTRLVRERNRILHGLIEATRSAEETVRVFEDWGKGGSQ